MTNCSQFKPTGLKANPESTKFNRKSAFSDANIVVKINRQRQQSAVIKGKDRRAYKNYGGGSLLEMHKANQSLINTDAEELRKRGISVQGPPR